MSEFKIGDWVRLTGSNWTGGKKPMAGEERQIEWFTYGDPCFQDEYGFKWSVADQGWEAELIEAGPEGADAVDPGHYKFPGGAEVIHISQWLTANSSQALQYIARSSRIDGKNKGDASEDIKKAIAFLEFELKRLGEGE